MVAELSVKAPTSGAKSETLVGDALCHSSVSVHRSRGNGLCVQHERAAH